MNNKTKTTASNLRIGDFSHLAQISVRTLRHYDELGLLKPMRIDNFTDYRYYSVEQLPRLNRILALKDLGFSLEQIAPVIKEKLSAEQLRGMLLLKRAELEGEIAEEQARLRRVEARVRQIEQEGKISDYEVVIKQVEPHCIASTRRIIPTLELMGALRQPMYDDVYQWLELCDIKPLEPEFAFYYTDEYRDFDIDMEAAVTIAESAFERFQGDEQNSASTIKISQTPAVERMASTIFKGEHPNVVEAFSALILWVCENGYQIAGAFRELHLSGSEKHGESQMLIEVQVPVEEIIE